MLVDNFSFSDAREYWKYAPSGLGKISTESLLSRNDEDFLNIITNHYNSRASHYWEDVHLVKYFQNLFKGKKVLSFGSGIGHNEILFLEAGCYLTCADIVQSNLDVISRVAELKHLNTLSTLFMEDSSETNFKGPYDYIYARGSLHHMPFSLQKKTMENFVSALSDNGKIILNLYSSKFYEATTPSGDPKEFAKVTDPSVNGLNNPWSEYYDDQKMLELCGDNLHIVNKQVWNNDYYIWWGLEKGKKITEEKVNTEFMDIFNAELKSLEIIGTLQNNDFELTGGNYVENEYVLTDISNYGYVMVSDTPILQEVGNCVLNVIETDISLVQGSVSIGILDIAKDTFIQSFQVLTSGRAFHYLPVACNLDDIRLVISNFSPDKENQSHFKINNISLCQKK
ncbi:methyltransferase domain-containing protein [Terasakiella sp.]|uniref:methyltransferase domain-containing protein n=1 Tax=Terasakiella sp. TaxID=2034861 RepID=UPI003AA91C3E